MADKKTVLFVDDDEIILRSIKRGFLDEPYIQLLAGSGEEALEILQKEEVHVIVTDMCMPGMGGVELLKIVREKFPRIVKIILSGYTDMSVLNEEFNEEDIFRFIAKPWKLETDFKKVIQQALEHYDHQNEYETIPQQIP